MNATEEILADNARKGSSRFVLRIAQAGRSSKRYDEHTLPLFGLPLILEAEGMLAKDFAYLSRCEALIREAAREMFS